MRKRWKLESRKRDKVSIYTQSEEHRGRNIAAARSAESWIGTSEQDSAGEHAEAHGHALSWLWSTHAAAPTGTSSDNAPGTHFYLLLISLPHQPFPRTYHQRRTAGKLDGEHEIEDVD